MKNNPLFLGALLLLTACAESGTPVAMEIVNKEAAARGFTRPLTLLESIVRQGVPEKLATVGLQKYDQFRSRVRNANYITLIDFTQHSGAQRFYMIHRATGVVEKTMTAHGTASDPDKDGFAQFFSNTPGSKMSSLGAYIVAERYTGKHGPSLRMDGLERTNDKARPRAVVMHPAKYVEDGKTKQGWSWGCPAVPHAWNDKVVAQLQGGSFMYAYGINQHRPTVRDIFWDQLSVLPPDHTWIDEAEEAPEDGELSGSEWLE